jgi:hypothetical protein
MSGNDDGEDPWSEDDLFDPDSALAFGARIEEIAVFLRREVEDVERKAFERNRSNSAKRVRNILRPPPRHESLSPRAREVQSLYPIRNAATKPERSGCLR